MSAFRAVLGLALSVIVIATTSCTTPNPERYDYFRVTVDGQQTLGISSRDIIVRGVVIYFHGQDGNEFTMTSDQAHKDLTAALVNAGFAVVSSQASGNAFGNPNSRRNYLYLGGEAANHYQTENLFFLAESMGALSAVNLMSSLDTPRFRGLAAINPMLDLRASDAQYGNAIATAYQGDSIDANDPMNISPDLLRDRHFRFYAGVPSALKGVTAFKDRFGPQAYISVVDCSGGSGVAPCFQGGDVVKWFNDLERKDQP